MINEIRNTFFETRELFKIVHAMADSMKEHYDAYLEIFKYVKDALASHKEAILDLRMQNESLREEVRKLKEHQEQLFH